MTAAIEEAAVEDAARGVAGHGLAGSAAPLPSTALGGAQWSRLLRVVASERMPGLLVSAVEEGAFPATPAQLEEARAAHAASMSIALVLERELLMTVALLAEAGIDYRVLKGSAVAHLDYPDPSLRSFGDVDLLVPADQFDEAVRLLVARGHSRQYAPPRPDFDRRFGKGTSFITGTGRDLDVHRTFVSGPFGLTVELADLFATSTAFELARTRLLALGPEERFLHACFHAALGDSPPRLVALRDVAQILLHTPLSTGRALHLAARWRAEPVVALAVGLAWSTFSLADVVALSVWAERYQFDKRERRALRVYTSNASYSAQAVAALWAIPKLADRAAYLRALLFPERSYLHDRERNYLRRMRRGARTLVQWGLRP